MVPDLVELPRPVDDIEERPEIVAIVIRILQHRKLTGLTRARGARRVVAADRLLTYALMCTLGVKTVLLCRLIALQFRLSA